MPVWMISALAMLAPLAGRALGALRGAAVPLGIAGAVTAEQAGLIDIIPGFGGGRGIFGGGGGGGGGIAPRRRRKKALTNTDMATMALIASTVSKKAAENFILMRVRR